VVVYVTINFDYGNVLLYRRYHNVNYGNVHSDVRSYGAEWCHEQQALRRGARGTPVLAALNAAREINMGYTLSAVDVPRWLAVMEALGADVPQVIRTESFRFIREAREAIAEKLCEIELEGPSEDLMHSLNRLYSLGMPQYVAMFVAAQFAAHRERLAGHIPAATVHETVAEDCVKRLKEDFGIYW